MQTGLACAGKTSRCGHVPAESVDRRAALLLLLPLRLRDDSGW